jgi:hypothetical protein
MMKFIKDKICKSNPNKNKLTWVNLLDLWHRGWDQDNRIQIKLKKIMKPNKKNPIKENQCKEINPKKRMI